MLCVRTCEFFSRERCQIMPCAPPLSLTPPLKPYFRPRSPFSAGVVDCLPTLPISCATVSMCPFRFCFHQIGVRCWTDCFWSLALVFVIIPTNMYPRLVNCLLVKSSPMSDCKDYRNHFSRKLHVNWHYWSNLIFYSHIFDEIHLDNTYQC